MLFNIHHQLICRLCCVCNPTDFVAVANIIGSGMTGLETSELLVSKGNKVTVVEMADKIAPGAWFQQLDDALPVLEKAGTEFLTSHKLLSVSSSFCLNSCLADGR